MTSKDLKIIDNLIERFENLPKVVDLRVKAAWAKISEDDHKLLFDIPNKLNVDNSIEAINQASIIGLLC